MEVLLEEVKELLHLLSTLDYYVAKVSATLKGGSQGFLNVVEEITEKWERTLLNRFPNQFEENPMITRVYFAQKYREDLLSDITQKRKEIRTLAIKRTIQTVAAQEAAQKAAQEAAQKAAQKAAVEAVRKATEEAARKATVKTVKEVIGKIVLELREEHELNAPKAVPVDTRTRFNPSATPFVPSSKLNPSAKAFVPNFYNIDFKRGNFVKLHIKHAQSSFRAS